jgi:hypothetical protein
MLQMQFTSWEANSQRAFRSMYCSKQISHIRNLLDTYTYVMYIYGLFNDAVSSTGCTALNGRTKGKAIPVTGGGGP